MTVLIVVCATMIVGCKPPEQISKYTAPKDPLDLEAVSDEPGPGEPKVRILAAIAPVGDAKANDWYFFKIQTVPKAGERHAKEFDEFLKSLKFAANGPPAWKLPEGWREAANRPERIATIRMKKSQTTVELTVTRFGGDLLANINRWRHLQAGLDEIKAEEIDTACRILTIDGRKVIVVDVSGPGGKAGTMPPFAK